MSYQLAERTGQAKAMVNNSGLSQLKRTWIEQPYTGWWILYVENISKPLENMNIKFIHDIIM